MTDLKTRIETATKSLEASAAAVEVDVRQLKALINGTPADQAGVILTEAKAASSSASKINSEAQRVAGIAADFAGRYLGTFDDDASANAAAVATKVVPPKAPTSLQPTDKGKLLAVKADASDYELVETIDSTKLSGKIKASQIDWSIPPVPPSQTSSTLPTSLGIPTGSVHFFAMPIAPTGYLLCNGDKVSRTSYAALFAAIGTLYGPGDKSTTFHLPDLQGEFIRALDLGGAVDQGRAIGTKQAQSVEGHTHDYHQTTVDKKSKTVPGDGGQGRTPAVPVSAVGVKSSTTAKNSSAENETRPRNIALLACIKT